ncbi:MAG: 30S ribosomal protein S12 methylthiotransferase RimO, partial [Clostridia bacterium]|nr:30S ribosomal protein S12 methylthiotransferase RimO [Clostridia bacterium]
MKVFIDTLGCPKNFNDSEMAKGILEDNNFITVNQPDEADVIVVNTCGFINDAKTESIARIFEMAEYKEAGKKIIVSGCLSERYSDELFEEMPEVDAFIGVNEYEQLPEILSGIDEGRRVKVSHSCSDILKIMP